jgi:hypothetical protein
MRAIKDIGMGLIYLLIAALMFFPEKFGLELAVDNLIRYMFGGICILYGVWRVYRGYRKDYFRPNE